MLAGIGYSRRTVGKSLREWVFWSQSVVGCQHFHPAGSRHAIAEVSATVQTAYGPSAAMQIDEERQWLLPAFVASCRLVETQCGRQHAHIDVRRDFRGGVACMPYAFESGVVATDGLQDSRSLPLLQAFGHVFQKAVCLVAHGNAVGFRKMCRGLARYQQQCEQCGGRNRVRVGEKGGFHDD